MEFSRVFAVGLLLVLAMFASSDARKGGRSKRNFLTCRPNSLVRYRLTLHTLWSKETFPKMYPTHRPHAQFSTLVGRTHGENFEMWNEGRNATSGVRAFAERADPAYLDLEASQGYGDVLDSFTAPPIDAGVGQTSTVFSLDGRRSLMSFMVKIIPSPDWFIGVSNLDLCTQGRWKKSMQINLRPLDAGTDRGLTFTAPNWASEPQEPVTIITSSMPNHPASSFYYPEYDVLPRLAYVDIDIVSEYRHKNTFIKVPEVMPGTHVVTEREEEDEQSTERDDQPVLPFSLAPSGNTGGLTTTTQDASVLMSSLFADEARDSKENSVEASTEAKTVTHSSSAETSPLETVATARNPTYAVQETKSRESDEQDDENAYSTATEGRPSPKDMPVFGMLLGAGGNDDPPQRDSAAPRPKIFQSAYDLDVDCEVGQWTEWSSCSKTCGFGVQERSREVVTIPMNAGANCPLLRQEELCGSMRNCNFNHFKFLSTGTPKRRMRMGRTRRRRQL